MTMPKINKNMILVVALVIVAIAGYFTFFGKSSTSSQLINVQPSTPAVGQELIVELNRLKSLRSINKDIFSNPVFVSLKDYTQTVTPQPFGRSNPFAPIGQ